METKIFCFDFKVIFPFNLTRRQFGRILLLKMVINIDYKSESDSYAVS